MEPKDVERYGKVAYESNLSNILNSSWEDLDTLKKQYWMGIAMAVIKAYNSPDEGS